MSEKIIEVGQSGAWVSLIHAGYAVGVRVTELIIDDEGEGDWEAENTCYLDPSQALLLGDRLVQWASDRIERNVVPK